LSETDRGGDILLASSVWIREPISPVHDDWVIKWRPIGFELCRRESGDFRLGRIRWDDGLLSRWLTEHDHDVGTPDALPDEAPATTAARIK